MSAMNSERACFELDLEEESAESTASSISRDDQYEFLEDSDNEAMVHLPSWPQTMFSDEDRGEMLGGTCEVPLWPEEPATDPKAGAGPVLLFLEHRLSDASTAASPVASTVPADSLRSLPVERFNSVTSAGSETPSSCEEESKLSQLIQRECAFLRITSSTVMALAPRSSSTKRVPLRSVRQCLRICIIGLPGLKRHKWQQPLAWAVAGVLERAGCPAFVRRGELFASLDTREGGELVRVDLCAPRDGDDE